VVYVCMCMIDRFVTDDRTGMSSSQNIKIGSNISCECLIMRFLMNGTLD
jgi:hypothetical protein